MYGVILYGGPATGKSTISRTLHEMDSSYLPFDLRGGRGNPGDVSALVECMGRHTPVIELRAPGEVDRVCAAGPAAEWTAFELWCPRDVARERLARRGGGDVEARMAAWAEPSQLDSRTLWLNTSTMTPVQAAAVVREPGLNVWYEVVGPPVVRRPDGPAPARGSYDGYAIMSSGRLRAHAGSGPVRPACVPGEVEILQSHDLWVRPPDESVERCPACVEAHPLP